MSKKAEKYIQSLDAALSLGHWQEVPELSRKVRKHSVSSTRFARSAEIQALLQQRLQQQQKTIDDCNFNDGNGKYYWLNLAGRESTAEKKLYDEVLGSKADSSSHDEFCEAASLFYLVATRQLLEVVSDNWRIIAQQRSPHCLQSLAVTGIAFELSGRQSEAAHVYTAATTSPSWPASTPSSFWRDHVLYRLAILLPSQLSYDHYLQYSKGGASSPTRLLHVLSTRPNLPAYQSQLFRITNFPSADRTNLKLLENVTQLMNPWFAGGRDPLQAEKQLDMLFEAAGKTFHSPRILRYISYVLTSLERYDEALLAVQAYLQIALHSVKAQVGGDIDTMLQIADTVYHTVSETLRLMPSSSSSYLVAKVLAGRITNAVGEKGSDSQLDATISAINSKALLLEYTATANTDRLSSAIEHLRHTAETSPSPTHWLDLSLAYALQGDIPSAMTAIKAALEADAKHIASLQCFANLLCCEELYERAALVLGQVSVIGGRRTFRERKTLFAVQLMKVRIDERIHGAEHALNSSASLFSLYHELFGGIIPQEAITNGSTPVASTPPQIPSIRIGPSSTEGRSDSRHSSIGRVPDRPDSAQSRTLRSTSLKLMHPQLHIPHHLNLRKSASTRSFQERHKENQNIADSSRSSSPLNFPGDLARNSVSNLSILAAVPAEPVKPDHQLTALELQKQHAAEILADLWLFTANLIQNSRSSVIDAEAATEEARKSVGPTQAVILSGLRTILVFNDYLSEQQIETVKQGFECALMMNPNDVDTCCAYADFLLTHTSDANLHIPRAYTLLEPLKLAARGASDPRVWTLSAQIAERRNEERAEAEYWRVVECSDATGVIPWSEIH